MYFAAAAAAVGPQHQPLHFHIISDFVPYEKDRWTFLLSNYMKLTSFDRLTRVQTHAHTDRLPQNSINYEYYTHFSLSPLCVCVSVENVSKAFNSIWILPNFPLEIACTPRLCVCVGVIQFCKWWQTCVFVLCACFYWHFGTWKCHHAGTHKTNSNTIAGSANTQIPISLFVVHSLSSSCSATCRFSVTLNHFDWHSWIGK